MSEIQKVTHLPTVANVSNLTLAQLADAANKESQAGDDAFVRGLQHYKTCGEYLIAAKAKGKAEKGSSFRWSQWLKENWKKSYRVAAKYMQLATNWEKVALQGNFSQDMGLDSALALASIEPETIEVEVIEKEIEKPNTVSKAQFDKQLQENQKLKKELQSALSDKSALEIDALKENILTDADLEQQKQEWEQARLAEWKAKEQRLYDEWKSKEQALHDELKKYVEVNNQYVIEREIDNRIRKKMESLDRKEKEKERVIRQYAYLAEENSNLKQENEKNKKFFDDIRKKKSTSEIDYILDDETKIMLLKLNSELNINEWITANINMEFPGKF